jgi:cobalt-zinc-cadmium efflux system protein
MTPKEEGRNKIEATCPAKGERTLPEHEQGLRGRLGWAVAITAAIFLAELIGGWWTGSLALLSDAFHVATDAFSLALTLLAVYLAHRPPSDRHTFGLHRLEIFAAAFNGGSLLVISAMLLWEAIERFLKPVPVKAGEMLVIAAIGLIANLIVLALLHRDTHHSLNVRSAVLHIVGDAASSVGVLAAGAIMAVTGWFWVDPAISLAITVAIAYQAGRVAWEAAHILMEGAPKGIDTPSVRDALLSLPHVRQVHDLHIWSLCSQCRYLSAHLVVSEEGLRDPTNLLQRAQTLLRQRFAIHHATLQLEANGCADHYLCANHHHPEGQMTNDQCPMNDQ